MVVTNSAGWSECSVWLLQRETTQDGVLGMVVTERDNAGWSKCLVWLLQRETTQDGVSAWYGYRERESAGWSARYGCDRERLCTME